MRKRSTRCFTLLLLIYVLVFTSIIVQASTGKLSGSISITASPTTITIGESTTISGSINPTLAGETITIWHRETGKPWDILATETTNATSQYSYIWTALAWGTYELKATWIGDTYAAESSIITVDVKAPPAASFTYLPHTPTIGETITFNASASYDLDGNIETYAWDFGDGTTGAEVTTTHAYTTADTYDVTLTVTDNDILTDTETKSITVSLQLQPPVAAFTESAETVYTHEVITFNASDSYDPDGTIVSYWWNFGDGTSATGIIVEHSYADNGSYTVTLTVTDNDGATHTATAIKTVLNRSPVASFTESPAFFVYINETIHFDASDSSDLDGNIDSYWWDFGDGTSASGVTTEHSYTLEGDYTVTLTVTDDDGATNSTSVGKMVLNRPPVAVFTESAVEVYINETIHFNASESYDLDGSIESYFWDFGDGTSSNGSVVEHAYADNGNYTVTLTVTDDDGTTDTATAIMTVLNKPPVAIFTESAEIAYVGEAITFNASDSYDPDGAIVSYFWDFGDGTDATGVTVSHAYDTNGTFTVTLTVTDDDDTSNSTSSTKTIFFNASPVASFTESAGTVYAGEVVTFDASDSYDPDGTIVTYLWDFGDGTNATDVVVGHSYADDDVYTITLTVTDDDGGTASKSATKTVSNRPPIASFNGSPTTVLTIEIVHFDASSSNDPDGSIISYFWDFGDGTDATGVTVNHTYEDDGVYTVTLTVTDDDGGTASKSATKTVSNRPPIALIDENTTIVDIDELIRFDASYSIDDDGSILSYFWDFGDGTNATMCIILDHSFAQNGEYVVTLTVTDDDGASSSASVTITVNSSSGWPLSLIAGTAFSVTAVTGIAIYAMFKRKKKLADDTTALQNKPTVTLYVPRRFFAGYEKLTNAADNSVVLGRT